MLVNDKMHDIHTSIFLASAGTTTIPTRRMDIAEREPIFHGGLHRFLYEVTSPLILSCNGELQRYVVEIRTLRNSRLFSRTAAKVLYLYYVPK